MTKCRIHPKVRPIVICPACNGGRRSERKAESSRRNGMLGGRPPKDVRRRKKGSK